MSALQALRDEGNTVIVVEHDPQVMRSADHLIDMGPGAGQNGGQMVAQGTPEEVRAGRHATPGAGCAASGGCEPRHRRDAAGLADDPRGARQQPQRRDGSTSRWACWRGCAACRARASPPWWSTRWAGRWRPRSRPPRWLTSRSSRASTMRSKAPAAHAGGGPIPSGLEQPGDLPGSGSPAAGALRGQPRGAGARAERGQAGGALLGLRRARATDPGYGFPAGCTCALRDLPRQRLHRRGLGSAPERAGAAGGLRAARSMRSIDLFGDDPALAPAAPGGA